MTTRFVRIKMAALIAALLLLGSHLCPAQLPNVGFGGGAGALGTDFATLSKLFGTHTEFSAKADFHVYDNEQKEKIGTTLNFACLDNKIRVEIDLGQMKNKDMPASASAAMKQIGMDRLISLVRPDMKASYLIFPGIQSYLNLPFTTEDADSYKKKLKIEKTPIGKETLDGHACVKNKVITTDDKGTKTEFTLWNATDLKDFPVQVMTKEKTDTVIIRYKEIKFAKPDGKQFELPADFKGYANYSELTQAALAKMMSEAGKAPAEK